MQLNPTANTSFVEGSSQIRSKIDTLNTQLDATKANMQRINERFSRQLNDAVSLANPLTAPSLMLGSEFPGADDLRSEYAQLCGKETELLKKVGDLTDKLGIFTQINTLEKKLQAIQANAQRVNERLNRQINDAMELDNTPTSMSPMLGDEFPEANALRLQLIALYKEETTINQELLALKAKAETLSLN